MKTVFIEAGQAKEGPGVANWGKFCVGMFDEEEWARRSEIGDSRTPLLRQIGWAREYLYIWVMDMQTGEAAYFRPGGSAEYDLNSKHQIWVCPMFEPFLKWLYTQDISQGLDSLPRFVELPDAPFSFAGYRRPGVWRIVDLLVSYGRCKFKDAWQPTRDSNEILGPEGAKELEYVLEGESERADVL